MDICHLPQNIFDLHQIFFDLLKISYRPLFPLVDEHHVLGAVEVEPQPPHHEVDLVLVLSRHVVIELLVTTLSSILNLGEIN